MDWVSLNKGALTAGGPPEPEPALVMDASFVPKRGKHTYGLDRFWNGSHSRAEKGLDISTLAWLAITDHCAYGLSVEQTPPSAATSAPEATRMDGSLDHLSRVVQAPDVRCLRYVIPEGASSKQTCVAGVRALELHQIGKLRADAHRRSLSQGPKRPGPGRQKTYDGKVRVLLDGSDTWRVLHVRREEKPEVLGRGLPLAYAQGMAEDLARSLDLERLVAADARWRQSHPSEKMVAFATRLGIAVTPHMRAGEVSDAITAIVGDWN